MRIRTALVALLFPSLAWAGPTLFSESEAQTWAQGPDGDTVLVLQSCPVSKMGESFKINGPNGTETLTRAQFDLLVRMAAARNGTATFPVFFARDEAKMMQWLEDPAHVGTWVAARDGNDVMLCHSQPDGQIAVYPNYNVDPTLHPRVKLRQSIYGPGK